MGDRIKEEIIGWMKTLLMAAILAGVINSFLIVNAQVPTSSMENTIMAGDRVVALRTAYYFGEPEQGDVAIFQYPDDPTGKTLYVKRVIGTPGDTIVIKEGDVYVNETLMEEPYIREKTIGSYGPFLVPEGCYFMMGDNRNYSLDSRFWNDTFVEKEEMLGKVVFKYYKGFERIV